MKLRNLGMCPSRAYNVNSDLTKIQPVGNIVVMSLFAGYEVGKILG